MKKLLTLNTRIALLLYFVADVIATGIGMGVPFFNILLGFPTGWYIARQALVAGENAEIRPLLWTILRRAVVASLVTLVLMAALWGRMVVMLGGPPDDLANFGIPLILYEPRASFIGWLVLMVFISPALQLLAAVFAAFVALLGWPGGRSDPEFVRREG